MKGDIKFSKKARIGMLVFVAFVLIGGIFNTYVFKREDSGDTNVYLNENVSFAGQVNVKVVGISVTENEEKYDSDGDELSNYKLNLTVEVEQENKGFFSSAKVTIKPNNFQLKSVNLKAKSKMDVFINAMFKETMSIMLSGAAEGGVNLIEESISFAGDYVMDSIENAENNSVDFKPIKPSYSSFEKLVPRKVEGVSTINLSFPIKKSYLESENAIVLTIDKVNRIEKRIFLITRPE